MALHPKSQEDASNKPAELHQLWTTLGQGPTPWGCQHFAEPSFWCDRMGEGRGAPPDTLAVGHGACVQAAAG